MGVWSTLLAVTILSLGAAHAAASGDAVHVLTDANFDEFLKKNPLVFVEFYAPWCGHCKALQPHFDKAAEVAKTLNPPVVFAKLDATDPGSEKAAEAHDVSSFPTLKLFDHGKAAEFSGERTEAGLLSWVRRRTGDVHSIMQRMAELTPLLSSLGTDEESSRPVILLLVSDLNAADAQAFKKLAKDSEHDAWSYILAADSSELAREVRVKYSVPTDPTTQLVVFRFFAPQSPAVMPGPFSAEAVTPFVRNAVEPPSSVTALTQTSFEQNLKENAGKLLLVEFYAPWCGYCKELKPKYEIVAQTFANSASENVIVAKVDATAEPEAWIDSQGVDGFPKVKAYKNGAMADYSGAMEADAIIAWAREKSKPSLIEAKSASDVDAAFGESDEAFQARVKEAEAKIKAAADPYAEDEVPRDERPLAVVVASGSTLLNNKAALEMLESVAFGSPARLRFVKFMGSGKDGLNLYLASQGRFSKNASPLAYKGDVTNAKEFGAWAVRSSLPAVMEFKDELVDDFLRSGITCVVFVFLPSNYADRAATIRVLGEVGNSERRDALFVYSENPEPHLSQYFGLPQQIEKPIVKIFHLEAMDNMVVYDSKDAPALPITSAYLEQVVKDYHSGSLKPASDGGNANAPPEAREAEEEEGDEEHRAPESVNSRDEDSEEGTLDEAELYQENDDYVYAEEEGGEEQQHDEL